MSVSGKSGISACPAPVPHREKIGYQWYEFLYSCVGVRIFLENSRKRFLMPNGFFCRCLFHHLPTDDRFEYESNGDVFCDIRFSPFFRDLPVLENANMLAYSPQAFGVKKDKEQQRRIFPRSTEPKVTGSNPVGCTF